MRIWETRFGELPKELRQKLRRAENFFVEGNVARALREVEICQSIAGDNGRYLLVCNVIKADGLALHLRWHEALPEYEKAFNLCNNRVYFPSSDQEVEGKLSQAQRRIQFILCKKADARRILEGTTDRQLIGFFVDIARKQVDHEREYMAWERLETLAQDEEARITALMGRAGALLAMAKLKEAKDLFYRFMRKFRTNPLGYAYIGGLYLLEGKMKAGYFLRVAKKLGGKGLGFHRNLFLFALLEEDNKGAGDYFTLMMDEDAEQAWHLVEAYCRGISLPLLVTIHDHFSRFKEAHVRPSRKRMRQLTALEETFLKVRRLHNEMREGFFPLVKRYWEMSSQELEKLSYAECMCLFQDRGDEEVEDFFATYHEVMNEAEFRDYIGTLKARRIPYGIMLLTCSQFLDCFVSVFEERHETFNCQL